MSTTSDAKAVKYTAHKVMGYKETLSGRQLDKVRYLRNNMSGVRVTVFPLTHFYSVFFGLAHLLCVP